MDVRDGLCEGLAKWGVTQLALAASGHLGYQDALTKVVAEDSDEEGEEGEEGEDDELDLGGAGTDDGDSSDDDAE